MADIAKRFAENPILTPADIRPSIAGMKVECLLNPGVFRFDDKIWLLLRVAERPEQKSGKTSFPIIAANGELQILEFDNSDPKLNRADPRIIGYDGKDYLTTMSHFRLVASRDGIDFAEDPSYPAMLGQGELESYGIEDCRVTQIGETYYLTFTQVSEHGVGVGLRSTSDWRKICQHGMVLPPHNKDCAIFGEQIGGKYYALHRPSSPVLGGNYIWLAESPDLLHWGQHRCLAHSRPGMWDSARVGAGAAPIRTPQGWLEIYHGADAEHRYCLGALLLDLESPWKVLARSREPIMEPVADYERTGFFGNVVFTNGHVVDGDTVTLYYGASDSVICGARLSIQEILDTLPIARFMKKFLHEYRHFLSYPHDMRILLLTNLIYAFVLPVIDVFVAAYVMRNSQDVKMVVIYQLAVYTGIPFTFLINGFLLQHVNIKRLYSAGMLLSGVSMAVMMSLGELSMTGVGAAGLMMGMSFGLFWANRDFLALSTTNDSNRNYYYGVETFFYTNTYVIVPVVIGWFIAGTGMRGWFGGDRNTAYQIVTAFVFLLTICASILVHRGQFENPPKSDFIFFRYHWLWNRMQLLAILKGLAQGYIVTAPAMLVMRLVGQEGALGTIQAVGGILSAFLLYFIGRTTKPADRIVIFTIGLTLFALGGLANALLFNAVGVLLFMACLLLGRPLHDIAYFPIQMQVIDTVSAIENRNKFAYIFNQEFGFFIGRFAGCGLFILLASYVSDTFALRYALLIIGVVQLLSIWMAKRVVKGCAEIGQVGERQSAQTPIPVLVGE